MFTYEFILKTRSNSHSNYETKYNVFLVPESSFDRVKAKYEKIMSKDDLLLINRCDLNGEFIEIVQ